MDEINTYEEPTADWRVTLELNTDGDPDENGIRYDDSLPTSQEQIDELTHGLDVTIVDPHSNSGTNAFPEWTFVGTRNQLLLLLVRYALADAGGDLDDLDALDLEELVDRLHQVDAA